MLADMAKDPLPREGEYDSATDPMSETSLGAFTWWENLLWLPAGLALGSAVFISTFVSSSPALVCRWNDLDPYEHGIYVILVLFAGSILRVVAAVKLRDADALLHSMDGVATLVFWCAANNDRLSNTI
jgi:hypothetical protein